MIRDVRWLAAWTIALAACGDDDASVDAAMPDAGGDAETELGPAAPIAPMAPADPEAPMLADWGCPTGFTAVTVHGEAHGCAPYGAGGRRDCPAGELHLPGTTGCVAIDPEPCATATGDVYVRAGATAPGDGTRESPFASLDDAIAAADEGDVISLAAGSYVGSVDLTRGVTLIGACASGTSVARDAGGTAAIVVSSGDVAVRRLTIHGVVSRGTGHVTLERAIVGTAMTVIAVGDAASLTATDVIVQGTPGGGTIGLVARGHGEVTLSRVGVLSATGFAIGATDDGRIEGSDVLVTDLQPSEPGYVTTGVLLHGDAALTLSRVVIDGGIGNGVSIFDRSTAQIEDAYVRDLVSRDDSGIAISARDGGRVSAQRVRIENVEQYGVLANHQGQLELTDFAIDGVSTSPLTPAGGIGIGIGDGSRASLSRGVVSHFGAVGVYTAFGATIEGRDLVVVDGRGDSPELAHASLLVTRDSTATFERIAYDAFGAGLGASRASTVTASDLTVGPSATTPAGVPIHGRALNSFEGATLRVARAHVEGHTEATLVVTGARAEVTDLRVIDTAPDPRRPWAGLGGVVFQDDASGSVQRVAIATVRQIGIDVQSGSNVEIADVVIADPRPDEQRSLLGRGLHFTSSATVRLDRAVIERAADVAMQVDNRATLDARDVRIVGPDDEGDPRRARGIEITYASMATLDRIDIARVGGVGAAAFRDSTSTMRNLRIRATRTECTEDDCTRPRAGFGVGSYLGATLVVEDFAIDTSAVCGVHIDTSSMLSLRRGRVVENPIGVCVSGPLRDDLAEDVVFMNEQNLAATELPVPEPSISEAVTVE